MYKAFYEKHYPHASPPELLSDLISTLAQMSNMIENKRENHAFRVAALAFKVGREVLGPDRPALRNLYFAGLLHDIGEVTVPDYIIFKRASLTPQEHRLITHHTRVSRYICSQIPTLEGAGDVIYWHHERWDGTGYPDGLYRDMTPMPSQVLSLCDSFDAIHHRLATGEDFSLDHVIAEIERFAGLQFNPLLIAKLKKLLEREGLIKIFEFPEADREIISGSFLADRRFKNLGKNYIDTILNFMMIVLEAKHKPTARHCRRVSVLAREMGRQFKLTRLELDTLSISSLLHDIGKIGFPTLLLDKQAGFTEEEEYIIRSHPRAGRNVVAYLAGFGEVGEIIAQHHELEDGTGYPAGLKSYNTHPLARILSLANLVDNLATAPHLQDAGDLQRIARHDEVNLENILSTAFLKCRGASNGS
jgi:HD-GYP domain-containing protein (c-di-GMP phosphodiesterase class II)